MTTASHGQLLGLYEFDGDTSSAWDVASNWEAVLDPFGGPLSGDPATPPDGLTSADIPLAGVTSTLAGQTALKVNIGTAAGAGGLEISSGDLAVGGDLFVGRDAGGANAGALTLSGGDLDVGDDITVGAGSAGTVIQSAGAVTVSDDYFVNAGGSLTITGGTINVGDRFITDGDGTVLVDGGDIVAADDFFFNSSGSQITVNSGSMIVKDKMRMDAVGATLTINGGLVRSQEFGFEGSPGVLLMNGIMEINGTGIYQSEAPGVGSPVSQLSIAHAQALIIAGTITTSEVAPLGLIVQSVIVPDFFGSSNLTFTQISIGLIPEPSSVVLMGLGVVGLLMRRRKRA